MTRTLAWLSLVACASAESPSEPPDVGLATSSDAPPLYRATFQLDGGSPLSVDLSALHLYFAVGDGCTPSVLVRLYSPFEENTHRVDTNLVFHEPLAVGVVAALPEPSAWTAVNSTEFPLESTETTDPNDDYSLFGGQARVVTLDPIRWEFVFEGDGLVGCGRGAEDCGPIEGALLVLEPIDPAGTLPESPEDCVAGELYPWPDEEDGCGVLVSNDHLTECPPTFPW